ncbi:hypothetical protein BOS5A_120047 [Bosea sp. EC-HK365B]|nr:hypothetical protein BOSE21B_111348 [Bosea sp. 21B]VVT55653.1 hypothetical protein BOS5A_120047 [Bosea sp. EC-HK365B]
MLTLAQEISGLTATIELMHGTQGSPATGARTQERFPLHAQACLRLVRFLRVSPCRALAALRHHLRRKFGEPAAAAPAADPNVHRAARPRLGLRRRLLARRRHRRLSRLRDRRTAL